MSKIVIKLPIGDKGKNKKVNEGVIKLANLQQLDVIETHLKVLNCKENVLIAYPNCILTQVLTILYEVNEMLKYIVVRRNALNAKPLNKMRSLGWKY